MPPSTSSPFLLGVEGTGVKTQAVVADFEGRVLGRGLGPSSNQHRVGIDKACSALGTAIEAAISQVTGVSLPSTQAWGPRIAAACLGLSGVDQPADQVLVADWLRSQGVQGPCKVLNDSELILIGGTPDGWGIALISGNGSVCLGRTPKGDTARVGGWGPRLGDEGSGYQMALQAMQVATQAADGRGDAHDLLRAILDFWKLTGPNQLVEYVHRPEVATAEIAELAMVVLELAAKGNPDALKIVNHAGYALGRHVETVAKQLALDEPPIALGGRHMLAGLRTAVLSRVQTKLGPLTVVPDPTQAAIRIARRMI